MRVRALARLLACVHPSRVCSFDYLCERNIADRGLESVLLVTLVAGWLHWPLPVRLTTHMHSMSSVGWFVLLEIAGSVWIYKRSRQGKVLADRPQPSAQPAAFGYAFLLALTPVVIGMLAQNWKLLPFSSQLATPHVRELLSVQQAVRPWLDYCSVLVDSCPALVGVLFGVVLILMVLTPKLRSRKRSEPPTAEPPRKRTALKHHSDAPTAISSAEDGSLSSSVYMHECPLVCLNGHL